MNHHHSFVGSGTPGLSVAVATQQRLKPLQRVSAMFAIATLLFAGAMQNAEAYFDVTIGTTDTAGAWAGNVWTPSGTGSTVSASTIQSNLAVGPVTIGTGTAVDGGTEAGNITVSSALSWDANTLTLTAADTININAVMSAGGTAGLVFNTGYLYYVDMFGVPKYFGINIGDHYGNVKMGMGGGGFAGRVDFTGSGNTMTINDVTATIITTLGAAGSTTGTDLQGLKLGRFYVLGADIDASATAGWNGGAGFDPVMGGLLSWPGLLDGLGHTISGLTIKRPGEDRVGLFGGSRGAAVRNLGMVNVDIVGRNHTGGLIGEPDGTVISDVFVTGSVTGAQYVGGLIGHNLSFFTSPSPIRIGNSAFSGTVSGTLGVGGLAGAISPDSLIHTSFATGSVNLSAGGYHAGGLVGTIAPGDTLSNEIYIRDSYFSGSLTLPPEPITWPELGGVYGRHGGLAGVVVISNTYATGTMDGRGGGITALLSGYVITNSFIDMVNASGGAVNGATATAQMQQQATFTGWDFVNTWLIYEGQTYPLLRSLEGLIDSDGDGYYNNEDDLPVDATEWLDTDGDGIGNNADTDDDNDGVLDVNDAFPLDATESVDTDGDGIGNNADTDDDNDGVLDVDDAFPLDATESVDTDGDGIGNNADPDDDNDGVLDVDDAYPLDPTRSSAPSSGGGGAIDWLLLLGFIWIVFRHRRINAARRVILTKPDIQVLSMMR